MQKEQPKAEPKPEPMAYVPKIYDLTDSTPYEEDRHLLIQKISSLENK